MSGMKSPRFVLTEGMTEDSAYIACPVCGDDYVHIHRVTVDQGSARSICESDFVQVRKIKQAGRGSLVRITFECESGHSWEYGLQFHKGKTTAWMKRRRTGSTKELWRD
jgi:hypothetical protein